MDRMMDEDETKPVNEDIVPTTQQAFYEQHVVVNLRVIPDDHKIVFWHTERVLGNGAWKFNS